MKKSLLRREDRSSSAKKAPGGLFEFGGDVNVKKRKSLWAFTSLSIISLCIYIGVVAYNWGYMQSAIDNHTAYFSAPSYLAIFTGIPFIIAAIVFAIIAIVVRKRK